MRFIITALLAAAVVMATPTKTPEDSPSKIGKRAIHTVWVGKLFSPDQVQANIGDEVEFHFLPGVFSVVESSYTNPCHWNGGFVSTNVLTNTDKRENSFAFVVTIQDDEPLWFYNGASDYCMNGAVGAINSPEDRDKSVFGYYRAAKTEEYSDNPSEPKGGRWILTEKLTH
ncbi:hypothetical protein CFO_g4674 [Ceratocystis platani]|uniref:Extracellular serine-rich protein n=1 Tax=Ceratocystis fimbriata f. sp. platani TaxID=88771 RepID=A0A0F8AXS9_CERFI|nr:hypothetical protein CFO_g4674 [Ceratocystis platani]